MANGVPIRIAGTPKTEVIPVPRCDTTCEQVAPLLLATPIGVWVEGRPKRKIVLVSEFFRFLLMMLITILAWRAIVSVWIA